MLETRYSANKRKKAPSNYHEPICITRKCDIKKSDYELDKKN